MSVVGSPGPVERNNESDCIFALGHCAQVTTNAANASIDLTNSGNLDAGLNGIFTITEGQSASIAIDNAGAIKADLEGISTTVFGAGSHVDVRNRGAITSGGDGISSLIFSFGDPGDLRLENIGNIKAGYHGIFAETASDGGDLSIKNSGGIASSYIGLLAFTPRDGSQISILNVGSITTAGASSTAYGIYAETTGVGGTLTLENGGDIVTNGARASAIFARTSDTASPINLKNAGDLHTVGLSAPGLVAVTSAVESPIAIENMGTINAGSHGIYASSSGMGSPLSISNAGVIQGRTGAIFSKSTAGTKIENTGNISANSHFAIGTEGASTTIFNRGMIEGYVALTDRADLFVNQEGGVIATKLTSSFNGGEDRFRNEKGGILLGASNPHIQETAAFVRLERFENSGLISLADGATGDVFEISNSPGRRDLTFVASGNSSLAIDAELGGISSKADRLIVNGDITGQTKIEINNTSSQPGVFNPQGIPVLFVEGDVSDRAFVLEQPLDTGFFNYDLHFVPTGSGFFELHSFLGEGAFMLPQLITAAQDIWHQSSSTLFDRTADLRVLLNGQGVVPAAARSEYVDDSSAGAGLTPALWVKGSGGRLDRNDTQTVDAYGRSYRYQLNRDLDAWDVQMGLDLGKRDFLSTGDILVFGALGGFVQADLDYDRFGRTFDFSGGQVGGYATYLRGGLFVDTLLNVHLMELDPNQALGFPSSLDATTVGVRTDTGYRIGSFNGAFIEPLATLSVTWADIDGFSLGGNTVSFDHDANLRGRLGVRVGTSMPVWARYIMEPFVIGSMWGNLSGDNEATLVSSGTRLHLEDDLEDLWGEVSAGVNFFNAGARTALFAKVDVTFGDDLGGIGGKGGVRVSW